MRTITTNWNSSSYNNSRVFLDRKSGQSVTVASGNPVNHRAMIDSVESGAYSYAPDAVVALPATIASAANVASKVVVNATLSAANVEGAPIKATTSNAAVAVVSPAIGNIDPSGNALFTVTSVASGTATITFTSGAVSDTVAVTVS